MQQLGRISFACCKDQNQSNKDGQSELWWILQGANGNPKWTRVNHPKRGKAQISKLSPIAFYLSPDWVSWRLFLLTKYRAVSVVCVCHHKKLPDVNSANWLFDQVNNFLRSAYKIYCLSSLVLSITIKWLQFSHLLRDENEAKENIMIPHPEFYLVQAHWCCYPYRERNHTAKGEVEFFKHWTENYDKVISR